MRRVLNGKPNHSDKQLNPTSLYHRIVIFPGHFRIDGDAFGGNIWSNNSFQLYSFLLNNHMFFITDEVNLVPTFKIFLT